MPQLTPLRKFSPLAAALLLLACNQSTKETLEYINAPINLSITQIGVQTYNVTFFSDNREGGFSGYGIFAAATTTDADVYPGNDILSASGFCTKTVQDNYKELVNIQIGPAASGTVTGAAFCDLNSVTLTSGNYVAVRARVERLTKPWSAAGIVRVP